MNGDLIKRSLIGVVAGVCLGFSLWTLVISVRNVLLGTMHLHGVKQSLIYFSGLAMFLWLIWLSIRGLRIALGVVPLSGPRLKMWRIFVGVLFILSLARTVLDPASNRYHADNLAQAIGMYCAWVIMCGLAIWLILSAFPRWQQTSPRPL